MSGVSKDQGDMFGYGTEPHKLHRADGTETSEDAAYSVDTSKLEREVHEVIKRYGKYGCISDEVRGQFPPTTPYSSVTARYSALLRKKYIVRGPDKRRGKARRDQWVMRDIQFAFVGDE